MLSNETYRSLKAKVVARAEADRALWFARGNDSALPGMDQEVFAQAADADRLAWSDLVLEFEAIRRSTVALFEQLDDGAWARQGTASGNPVSVRALALMVAGHELHHLKLLEAKYLGIVR